MSDNNSYPPVFVSRGTLAYLLDCSPSTIDVYVKGGIIPKPIMIGTMPRWDFTVVKTFIEWQAEADEKTELDPFIEAVCSGADKEG